MTITELLVASAITTTVTGSVLALLSPVYGIFRSQPEAADVQQRVRVGVDMLVKDLAMAGAGPYTGPAGGPLLDHLAPLLPYRVGEAGADPSAGVFHRLDAITVLYVPSTPAQTTVAQLTTRDAHDIAIDPAANCPAPTAARLCGFASRTRVLLFDAAGSWDLMTVTDVSNPMIQVRYAGTLSRAYARGSTITEVVAYTYYLKSDPATGASQLMRYDAAQSDSPVIDNVVGLEFTYFGDPQPPMLLPERSLGASAPTDPVSSNPADLTESALQDDATELTTPESADLGRSALRVGPFTTYGPRPPPIDVDDPNDSWPAGENCLFTVHDAMHVPRLAPMGAGSEVELRAAVLTDGPWCVDVEHTNRFDADLLRIRRVRVTLRIQAAAASMRGPAGVLFRRGGTGTGRVFVPDQEVRIDVTPRNMNLAR
jgi:hypothetical protein